MNITYDYYYLNYEFKSDFLVIIIEIQYSKLDELNNLLEFLKILRTK